MKKKVGTFPSTTSERLRRRRHRRRPQRHFVVLRHLTLSLMRRHAINVYV